MECELFDLNGVVPVYKRFGIEVGAGELLLNFLHVSIDIKIVLGLTWINSKKRVIDLFKKLRIGSINLLRVV